MQEVGVFDIKTEIKKHLKTNPDELIRSIEGKLEGHDQLASAKTSLDLIIQHNEAENEKDTQRKKLSREIGQAKKRNEDCDALISRVSALSAEIKALKAQREQACQELEVLLHSANDSAQSIEKMPRHFSGTAANEPVLAQATTDCTVVECTNMSAWQSFVDGHENANLYHDSRWHALIDRNFGQTTTALTCVDSTGNLLGLMPLTHLNSKLFGSFTVSMPYFNYGGPLATDRAIEGLLMQHAAELSDQKGCTHMEIRETAERDNWLCSQKKVSMVLELPDSDEALDRQLGSKLRAQVKRASSHNLTVRTGRTELVDDFYAVYSHNMRDLGTPAYSIGFFRDIVDTFEQESFITVVQQGRKTLAAGFMLGYKDKLEIPWASSLRKYNHLGANMLMYRTVLSEAMNRGYEFFDFGRSTRDANTYRFKKQWGAKEYPLYWHYWTREGKLPEINPDNPKYKLVIAAWQKMPVALTRIIGPMISRNLP